MTFFESGGARVDDPREDDPFSRMRTRHRRSRRVVGWSVVAALLVALVAGVGLVGPTRILSVARDALNSAVPEPAADLIAVADQSSLTDEGRALLYASRPRLVGADVIAELCPMIDDGAYAVGCFSSVHGLIVYRPADERLAGSMVQTLVHELLHAVYETYSFEERAVVDELVAADVARLPADDPLHSRLGLDAYSGIGATESFAYIGSEARLEGGIAPDLASRIARYVSDREAVIAAGDAAHAALTAVGDELRAANDEVARQANENAMARAQWEADHEWHEAARATYNDRVAEYNAMSAEQQARSTMGWTEADGSTSSAPIGEALAKRLRDLEALRVDLDARAAALADAEAALATRQPELDAMYADVRALWEAAAPGQEFE